MQKWNVRQFAHVILNIFLCKKISIENKISLTFVPERPIKNDLTLVQIMTWRRTGDKSLFEPKIAWYIDTYTRYSTSIS